MSNYMTLQELHDKMGTWIQENPEHKHKLVCKSSVAGDDDDEYFPGSVLLTLGISANDEGFESDGVLEIRTPKTGKYAM